MKQWILLCAVAAALGCASTEVPRMVPGEQLADGHLSLRPLVTAPADEPWDWQSPPPSGASARDQIIETGPLSATAFLWFRAYQATLSRVDGATCRFRPTCSGFAVDAIARHGLLGAAMSFGRLARNHNAVRDYHVSEPPFLDDPVQNYGFGTRRPWLDDFRAYDDPAHAWYQHVRATRRMR